ncbi:MAG TPA: iron ABC transporter permease, partial [Phycisphaerales bacterium]|nr:iron ABC transporter permease [Phycisphaerales bacterium]
MRRGSPGAYLLLLVLFVVLGALLLYPIGLTVRGGFAADASTGTGFTLRHITGIFADPVLREGLLNSVLIATTTTILSTVIALPLAVLAANHKYPLKGLWNALILVPMILPPFVGAIGVKAILGRAGALNALLGTEWDILGAGRFWGVCAVQALYLYPI